MEITRIHTATTVEIYSLNVMVFLLKWWEWMEKNAANAGKKFLL